MEQKSMTAFGSAFARAFHAEDGDDHIFRDTLAKALLGEAEYNKMAGMMAAGIAYFNPEFQGTPDEALRWIVNNRLAPSPLGRAAFAEGALQNAVAHGATQYVILAAGYDTFAWRQPPWANDLQIFELDHPATGADKARRTEAWEQDPPANLHTLAVNFSQPGWETALESHPAFHAERITFCSLLGLSYYLPKEAFKAMVGALARLLPRGSALAFDCPDEAFGTEGAGVKSQTQVSMAAEAGEPMVAAYSYSEMEALLAEAGVLVYEHLTPQDIAARFFDGYNERNPEKRILPSDHVDYYLAVRQ